MSTTKPIVLLVHGAFAGSDSWDGVVERLLARSVDVVALANPLRSVTGDAAYVRDVITAIGRPVVLVGHSYGGIVVTGAAADNEAVRAPRLRRGVRARRGRVRPAAVGQVPGQHPR